MPFALAALVAATLFSGAALYITVAEQPARLALPEAEMLAQWKPSYARGLPMQLALVVAATLAGLAAWWSDGRPGLLLGAGLMVAKVPMTFALIMPINRRLMATPLDAAGPETRVQIRRWGRLHAIRTALGLGAVLTFVLSQ